MHPDAAPHRHCERALALPEHDAVAGGIADPQTVSVVLGLEPRGASSLQAKLHKKMAWLTFKTRILRPYMYLLLSLLLLPMCRGNRDVFVLLMSGLVTEASLFPTAFTPDLRVAGRANDRLAGIPEWNSNAGIQYELNAPFLAGTITPRVDWFYTGSIAFSSMCVME